MNIDRIENKIKLQLKTQRLNQLVKYP